MILQSLAAYYDRLVEQGKLAKPGWQPVKVHFALQIDRDGRLIRVLPLMNPEMRGKKEVMVPQTMNLPEQVKRTVGISANFLCDNASYMLGIDAKGKPERAKKCFEACKLLHLRLLGQAETPAAQAVVRFFDAWKPDDAANCEALKPYWDDILAGANILFFFEDRFIHEYSDIQAAWDHYYSDSGDAEKMRCLVTGEFEPIARLHPCVKGIAGGQSSGTSLVSFNAPAYESFGRDGGQGLNAPVSERAAFAYSAALNWMIAEDKHHIRLSDMTIVFWAEGGMDEYAKAAAFMLGESTGVSETDLFKGLKDLAAGQKALWDEAELNPDERFFILGLSPNAARLSVRFFLQNTFGDFAKNLLRHHERLAIKRPSFDPRESLSFRQLLSETANQNARDKTPSPLLSGSLMRAVLTDLPYPALLLNQTELRIRAEHEVTRGRAAIIKAYLMQNMKNDNDYASYKEAVENVNLDENTTYAPYLLGRLFAVLEGLQQAANPGINATIRDRYFNSACATPAVVFPQLVKLAQAHLNKLNTGSRIYFEKQIVDMIGQMSQEYPARLNLRDQGIFQLGYYHQTQKRFTKKEEKDNG
ncbi:MAG: type I-C CRISPR-associated protein Cas8c/Csd1 [Clostridia bacterium]|nr:type I-C CRISPR-associated protein Cas8c/Csd1 [Clostridia bacterium]